MPAPSLEDLTTDQLLAHARMMQGSHDLMQTLLSDPATRPQIQRMLKTKNPSLSIPEIDTADAVRAEIEKEREARKNLEQKLLERDVRERLEKQRAAAKAKYSLTEEDMAAVEALMTDAENPIPTYDAAARVHKASKTTATPTTSHFSPPTFEMPENDVWGKGVGNKGMLDKIALNEAAAALNEIRSGKVAGLGPAAA